MPEVTRTPGSLHRHVPMVSILQLRGIEVRHGGHRPPNRVEKVKRPLLSVAGFSPPLEFDRRSHTAFF